MSIPPPYALVRTAATTVACLVPLFSGCDYEADSPSHIPPPGLGTMIIDNYSYNHIAVFVDGFLQTQIAHDHAETPYDLRPGVYRLVLEERGGQRNFRSDIDILSGRLTIIEIFEDPHNWTRYHGVLFFD